MAVLAIVMVMASVLLRVCALATTVGPLAIGSCLHSNYALFLDMYFNIHIDCHCRDHSYCRLEDECDGGKGTGCAISQLGDGKCDEACLKCDGNREVMTTV
jgi:hypothetical protein